MPLAETGTGERVKVLALIDRIADVQQELLTLTGSDPSVAMPAEQFRAEVHEAENLLRLARGRLLRALGSRGRM